MRRSTALLIFLVLAGLVWVSRPGAPPPVTDGGTREATPEAHSVALATAAMPAPRDTVVLDGGRCAASGYLCAGFAELGQGRVIRWPDGTRGLTVRVPVPEGLDPALAGELQRQAAAGIREWQGRPLPLTLVPPSRQGEAVDVEVRWTRSLTDDRVGQAAVRWRTGPEGEELAVLDFILATHTPGGVPLEPHRLRLTAAHEMGHVLGLPHSDDPADVMHAFNTATRLTFRDFRSVEVLYTLPAGALVVVAPEAAGGA